MSETYPLQDREVIIEMRPFGTLVRISAMDTKTMTEITLSGPKTTPESILKRNALKRLEYVMKKKGLI